MNQPSIPDARLSGPIKNYMLLCLLFSGVFSCTLSDQDTSAKAASTWKKSPFAGTWISSDSNRETAFKLVIVQEQDSLKGYYCLIKQEGEQSECQMPDSNYVSVGFAAKAPQNEAFSTELYNLEHELLGHVQLTLTDSILFWQLLSGPDDHEFMIRQTTFRIDAPLK